MSDFVIWKTVVDAALVLSLFYLCYRVSRSNSSSVDLGALREIEGSLRGLMKEANSASAQLEGELVKRQRSLEQLLFDLETVESRLNRGMDSAEEVRKVVLEDIRRLEGASSQAASHHVDPYPARAEIAQPQFGREARYSGVSASAPVQRTEPLYSMPEPPSFEEVAPQVSHPNVPAAPEASAQPAEPSQPVNIYGEPIGQSAQQQSSPSQAAVSRSNLRDSIEKEVSPAATRSPSQEFVHEPAPEPEVQAAQGGLEEVYAAAEELLRAGKDLQGVAIQTNLPIEEVQMLAHIVQQEQKVTQPDEQVVSDSDSRLGALGGIRRERQLL